MRVGVTKWFDPNTLNYFEKAAPKPRRSKTPTPAAMPVHVQSELKPPPQRKASTAALSRGARRDPNMFAGGLDMQPPPGLAIPAQLVHLAPVVAKSTSARQNCGKPKGRSCCTWGCRSLWKSAAFCFKTIPTLALFSPALGVALAALLHNMATLTGAAGKFADAGASVSVAFAHLAVSGTSETVSIINETWHGVDLTQLEVHAESG